MKFDLTMGNDENHLQSEIRTYPNPASEFITVTNLSIGSIVNIFDISGKIVYSSTITNEQTKIFTSNLTNGTYFIQLVENGIITYRKLIVSK